MDVSYFAFVLLLVHFQLSDAAQNEPVCSKFPYEEQLLGKMTRVEVKMEQWDKELKKFEESVLSVLEHRREEMEILIKVHNTKMDTFSEEYEQLREAITNRTTERPDTPIVAFNAYLTTRGSYKLYQIIEFPHILLNEGNGYDATSGYFTAPISGLYQFITTVCNDGRHHMIYAIFHEKTKVALSSVYEDNSNTCGSVGAMVKMEVGERVCVKSMYDRSQLYASDHRWPSFMGVLLQKGNT